MNRIYFKFCSPLLGFGLFALTQPQLLAQAPTVTTIPFAATNNPQQPASPVHPSWSGNPVTLKGVFTSPNLGTDTFTWDWNPGDGGAHCTGTITTAYSLSTTTNNPYAIGCAHTYTGSVGQTFTAFLTVNDTTNNTTSGPIAYYTSINGAPPNLPVEADNAIDNGLWYLHIHMRRLTTGTPSVDYGDWYQCDNNHADACEIGYISGPTGSNCVAFENSGFLQVNNPLNPYSDDVRRCLNRIFNEVEKVATTTVNASQGSYNPDSNGNGYAVGSSESDPNYNTGMMLDAIAASQSPTQVVTPGTVLGNAGLKGTGTGGAYTYTDAIFDMVDWYSYCETLDDAGGFEGNVGPNSGGWHYDCQEESGDNSVSQWAAIGIIPARRKIGLPLGIDPLPPLVQTGDQAWLNDSFTQNAPANGYFGYTSNVPLWGPFADTPSGMVQLAMNGKGRGTKVGGVDLWDNAETYMRDNWDTASSGLGEGGPGIKGYYYGMLSFTKSMLLHDNNDTGFAAPGLNTVPITLFQSLDDPNTCAKPVPAGAVGSGVGPCYPTIDWYGAQTSTYGGTDPTNGVARTLVSTQGTDGSWYGHNYTTAQYYLETGFAITMLNQTVFQAHPVACFTANPTKVASGGPVVLDGGCSVEQIPGDTLVTYEWDVSGTGGTNFTIAPGSPYCQVASSCVSIKYNFTAPQGATLPYSYPVRLRVIDNAGNTNDVVGDVVISSPPNPPQANAGGPYNFCPNTNALTGALIYAPFILDGSKSTNPDQGQTDGTPGAPPSTITSYAWDLTGACSVFTTIGEQINVTSNFDVPADFGTTVNNICLKVTNNDNLAFPSANLAAGLSSIATAQVTIHQPSDEACTHCVNSLGGAAKAPSPGIPATVQLYWTDTNTATFPIDHYNIYRSTCPPTGAVGASCTGNFAPDTLLAGPGSVTGTLGIPVSNPSGGTLNYVDSYQLVGGTTYYYRIAPATANNTETCQGNVTVTVAISKGR